MKKLFFLYFCIYYLFLFIYANYLNIGNFEIGYLSQNYPMSLVEKFFLNLFDKHSNLTLRLPELLLSIFSIPLFYKISQNYLKKEKDVYLSTIIFSLLPGFIIASLLFNKSIYIIFLLLIFIYSFIYYRIYSYFFLLLFTITDNSFIALYLGLIFYSIYKKDTKFLIYSIFLLMINANYFHYDIKGYPRGHFVDIILIYSAIFSPFVFIYFVYSLIKIFKKPTLLWFISASGLLFSLLLSLRQRIRIDDFAPFVIVSAVFMIAIFLSDYRVRLQIFRPKYRRLFIFLFFSMVIFDGFILASPYFLNKKIVTQFRYSKQIFNKLKTNKIDNINCNDTILCEKLYFYGLKKGNKYFIFFDKKDKKVSISHNHKILYHFYVSKLNK